MCSHCQIDVFVFRYIFLFDKVVIVCKRKGYSYELKEIIELQSYKMSDDPMNNRDMKKVRNSAFWIMDDTAHLLSNRHCKANWLVEVMKYPMQSL